jgi:uncharacterized protein YodC (DUF2158 family)
MGMSEIKIGAVVTLQSGGGEMTIAGGPSYDGLFLCSAFDSNGWTGHWLPPEALKLACDELSTSEIRGRNRMAIETLRETFTLRAGCNRVDDAAEDASAEFQAYREQWAIDERLAVRDQADEWRTAAASYPDGLTTFLEALRSNGQDGDLRSCAADVLEALAK